MSLVSALSRWMKNDWMTCCVGVHSVCNLMACPPATERGSPSPVGGGWGVGADLSYMTTNMVTASGSSERLKA